VTFLKISKKRGILSKEELKRGWRELVGSFVIGVTVIEVNLQSCGNYGDLGSSYKYVSMGDGVGSPVCSSPSTDWAHLPFLIENEF
jgi:hypothetical protein